MLSSFMTNGHLDQHKTQLLIMTTNVLWYVIEYDT